MREKWKSITRDDLFKRMSEKPSVLRKEDIKLAATNILEQLSQALCVGQRIELRGFGSFTLRYRSPRMSHNPKTGEKFAIAGKHYPHFKAGRVLLKRVNKKKK